MTSKRMTEPISSPKTPVLTASEVRRYARHIVLREIGGAGQQKIKKARIVVIGAGGIGSPVLFYLNAVGIGCIGIIDDDVVSESNLQRQIIHSEKNIGIPKTSSAKEALINNNPYTTVVTHTSRIDAHTAIPLLDNYDIVIDGSDNFETRRIVNRACLTLQKPLILAAISQWEGQLSVFSSNGIGPCYECIFPSEPPEGQIPDCATAGVLGALPGVIGSMAAVEAIKLLTGSGEYLLGKLLIYDALHAQCRIIRFGKDSNCAACMAGINTKNNLD